VGQPGAAYTCHRRGGGNGAGDTARGRSSGRPCRGRLGGSAGRARLRLAKEAAHSLVAALQAAGWAVVGYTHPVHLASQQVARAGQGRSHLKSHLRVMPVGWAARSVLSRSGRYERPAVAVRPEDMARDVLFGMTNAFPTDRAY
jgi:hypothetical protein